MIPTTQNRAVTGFSLVEALISVAIIGLAVAGIYTGMLKVNEFAVANRLNSCATQIVLSKLDQALSVRPFYPTAAGGADPFVAARNTSTYDAVPASLMVSQALNTPVVVSSTNIFIDSDALALGSTNAYITGRLTTLVSDASIVTGGTIAVSGTTALRSVNVTLSYTFRGRDYAVQMTCLRAPDQ